MTDTWYKLSFNYLNQRMQASLINLAESLEHQIALVSRKVMNPFDKINESFEIAFSLHQELEVLVGDYQFANLSDEIQYYKYIKPKFTKYVFLFNKLNRMHVKRESTTIKKYNKYLQKELYKIETFIEQNEHLINCYQNNITDFDNYYFTRARFDKLAISGTTLITQKVNNLTNGDIAIAKFLAYKELNKIYHNELAEVTKGNSTPYETVIHHDIEWTASKSDLIELMYALISIKAINNGKVEIKQLTKHLESMFNIQLGDPYRLFAAIRQRKKSPTRFIDSMNENFKQALNELDDFPPNLL